MRYRHFGHWLAGGLAGWMLVDFPLAGVGLILAFFGYEIWQGYRIKDMSYWDMLEFTVTLFIFSGGIGLWRSLSG